MDFYEVVKKRRTVRDFQSKLVEEEKLMAVLAAGLKAPTHNHLREWEFILIKDPEQRRRVIDAAKGQRFFRKRSEKSNQPNGRMGKTSIFGCITRPKKNDAYLTRTAYRLLQNEKTFQRM